MGEPVNGTKRKATRSYTPRKKSKRDSKLMEFSDMCDMNLIHVFECMDIISLARMSKIDERFNGLIMKYIIPHRTIRFSEFSKSINVQKIFETFGKVMTRIIVRHDDIQIVHPRHSKFTEFLRILIKYGEPGQLKDVDLTFSACHHADDLLHIFQDAAPYFKNVQKMHFDLTADAIYNIEFTDFIVAMDMSSLRELYLHNVCGIDEWFVPEEFLNLKKFHLCFSSRSIPWNQDQIHAINNSLLMHFIFRMSSLIDFECNNARDNVVFAELSRRIPSIESVGEVKYWQNDGTVANNNGGGGITPRDFHEAWKYFDAFTHLKNVSMRSDTCNFSDAGEAFRIMAKHQTIEELQLTFGSFTNNRGNSVNINDLKRLTRLKTLHLTHYMDESSKDFVDMLLASLPALTTCTIEGSRVYQKRIIELIGLAKNLKVLKLLDSGSFSVPFYKKLVKLRAPPNGQDNESNQLVIHIDEDSARNCVGKLGKRYKPNIIMLRSN